MKVEKISKKGKAFSVVFLIATFFYILGGILSSSQKCFEYLPSIVESINGLSLLFALCMQFNTLLLIFFERVHRVFKDTPLRLSKCTINSYYIFFAIAPIQNTVISFMLIAKYGSSLTRLIIAIGGFVYFIILTISMLFIFVRRLVHVYISLEFVDRRFAVNAITRVMVLTSISVIMTLLDIFSFIFSDAWGQYLGFPKLGSYIVLLDIYTNFLCVALSLTAFKSWYKKCCKSCDKCCRCCWVGLIDCCNGSAEAKDMHMTELSMNSNGRKTTDHGHGLQLQVLQSETKSNMSGHSGVTHSAHSIHSQWKSATITEENNDKYNITPKFTSNNNEENNDIENVTPLQLDLDNVTALSVDDNDDENENENENGNETKHIHIHHPKQASIETSTRL